MSARSRVLLVLLGAFVFGLLDAWVSGQDTDRLGTISLVRGDLGDLSTPWLLVAFIAGAQARRSRSGALLGLAATMLALLAFYLMTSLVVDLGGEGIVDNFGRELRANRVYLAAGLLTGPLFGALGAWWRRARSLGASVVAGVLLMSEPIVSAFVGIIPPASDASRRAISLTVYAAEFALGLVILLVALMRSKRTSPDEPPRDAGGWSRDAG